MDKLIRKIYVVLWKHAVERSKHVIVTLLEILLPVLIMAYVVFLTASTLMSMEGSQVYEPQYSAELLKSSSLKNYATHVYYAPSTKFTDKLMNCVDDALQDIRRTIIGVKNEDDIIHAFNTLKGDKNVVFIGIIFNVRKEAELPKTLKYQIRSKKNLMTEATFPADDTERSNEGYGQYVNTGIGALQLYIDSVFIDMVRKEPRSYMKDLNVTRFSQQFSDPYSHATSIAKNFLMGIACGFFMSYIMLLTSIVSEKQIGIKEFMKLNGVKTWIQFTCWFVNTLFVNMISVTGIVLLMRYGMGKLPAISEKSDPILLWTFLTMFCISGICFAFAISSFFVQSTLALVFGVVILVVLIIFIPIITTKRTYNLLLCLLPHGGLYHGMVFMWYYELTVDGLQWDNVNSAVAENSDMITMSNVFILYLVGIIIFTLITWYMDSVKPGNYGVARPWYYLCTVFFLSKNSIENLEPDANVTENFETPPDNLKVGIRIKNLVKIFTSVRKAESKVAVDGLNLDIYHGEITALLGHNGAGKTVTMSILSGMYSPTSGSVLINDYDINNNMEEIRENLGLCPQSSFFIRHLTVEENLIFFGMLKGLSKNAAKTMSEDILNKLDLVEKKNCLTSKLSGGMKRKLSLAIALCGDPKVLILDEPTSGLDVEVRRKVWNVLLSIRRQKTILISTHYMEEADVLGDRVAIMDHGKIKCYGSTLFLKKIYGTGYNLSIIKLDGCNESAVWDVITKNIPEATIKNLNGPVMYFSLPMDQASKFPKLFDSLEGDTKKLQIGGVGVSLTTLEDVFLNVGKESEDEASEYGSSRSETYNELDRLAEAADALNESLVTGLKLIRRQIPVLLLNNLLFTYRNCFKQLVKVVPLLGFTFIALKADSLQGVSQHPPTHQFMLNNYGRTEVLLHPGLCHEGLIESYKKEIESTDSKLTVISDYTDIKEVLLHQAVSNIAKFRKKIIIAAEFKCHKNSIHANAMYSNAALHGFPISENIMSNALLKFFNNNFSIDFSYCSFKNEYIQQSPGISNSFPYWTLFLTCGILLFELNFIELPLLERVSKTKHMKLMAQVNPITYWLSHFLWDFVCYSFAVITVPIIIIVFDENGRYSKPYPLGVLFLLLLLYGFPLIPFVYVCSFLSGRVSTACVLLVLINYCLVTVLTFALHLLQSFTKDEDPELANLQKIIQAASLLLPFYAFVFTITKYFMITGGTTLPPFEEETSYFSGPKEHNLKEGFIFFGIGCLLYFFILLLIEFGLIKKVYTITENFLYRRGVVMEHDDDDDDDDDEDDDVKEEELRVRMQLQGIELQDSLLAYKLVKKYKFFPAVKGISFGVSEGECFGLLGGNGAGKTTTFQMLTGDIIPSSGTISAFGYKLSENKLKYLAHIGYCPQFNALDEHLTGLQLVTMYAKLRGVPDDMLPFQINSWINVLGLNEYSNKVCGTYSGGNKRKLNTGVALIGNPRIVFLDEPTTGVDPVSRRKIWNILGQIHKTGQAVVLTSHSMEECEALCTRLVIMVAGLFMCVGNCLYLKQKFGQGFTVMIKMKSSQSDTQEVKSYFQDKAFPNICILKDEHLGLLQYQITDPKVTLKQLFTTLEAMKKSFQQIEDYAVSGTTLEQIFLLFTGSNTGRIAQV